MSQLRRPLVVLSFNGEGLSATNRLEHPIVSSRCWAIQQVRWPNLGEILGTAEEIFEVPSTT